MANFTEPMKWSNKGIEPSETLKNQGFKGGYKPPAEVFNYFFNKSEVCIEELQKATDKAQNTADSAATAASSAQSTAESAGAAAEKAQTTADGAKTATDKAQSTADGAKTAADKAQSTADDAKAAAAEAQTTAEGKADGTHKHKKTDITDFPTSMKPTSHASTNTTYGVGNSSNYGHLKLSDSTNDTSGVSSGIAATPAAVKSVKAIADEAKSTADSAKSETDKAQNTANSAATAASSAQSTAESAGAAAVLAQAAADDAKAAAEKAQTTADDAKTAAEKAQTTADGAKTAADKAQNDAKNFITKDEVKNLTNGTLLSSGTDLNTLFTPGWYYGLGSTSYPNCPITGRNFVLCVFPSAEGSSTGERVAQMFITTGGTYTASSTYPSEVYVRGVRRTGTSSSNYSYTTTSWTTLATSEDITDINSEINEINSKINGINLYGVSRNSYNYQIATFSGTSNPFAGSVTLNFVPSLIKVYYGSASTSSTTLCYVGTPKNASGSIAPMIEYWKCNSGSAATFDPSKRQFVYTGAAGYYVVEAIR